jgi:hypothetical protein
MKLKKSATSLLLWVGVDLLLILLMAALGSYCWTFLLGLFLLSTLGLQIYAYFVIRNTIAGFRSLPFLKQLALIYVEDPPQHLIKTHQIIPLRPLRHPIARSYVDGLTAMGFIPQTSIVVVGAPASVAIRFTHPSLACAVSVNEYTHPLVPPTLSMGFVQPDGTRVTISGPIKPELCFHNVLPGQQSIDLPEITVDILMDQYRRHALAGHSTSTIQESILLVEFNAYELMRQWRSCNFQFIGPYSHLFESSTQPAKDLSTAQFMHMWENAHTGFLIRHRHNTGQPDRPLTQKEIDTHLAAHAGQTSQEFFTLLLRKLDQRPSASHVRFVDAVNAASKKIHQPATGLQACEYLQAQNPDAPLIRVATFDHPVQAHLLKII